ncbi:MAG: hypothetical protein ACHREM_26275 [Polyangiales bacterium]
MRRSSLSLVASALAFTALSLSAAPRARASIVDLSAQVGLEKRSLSTTDYANAPFGQLDVDFGIIPGLLYLGPYANYAQLRPILATKDNADVPNSSKFYGFGLRARLNIPIPEVPITPYGVVGGGMVHTDFPDQTVQLCTPATTVAGVTVAPQCASQTLPAATANFVELMFAAGVRLDLSDTVRIVLEGAWKPTFGYQNDTWELAAHGATTTGNLNPPPPGRNGYALSASAGLMISL